MAHYWPNTMKNYIYTRVSTTEQDLASQMQGIYKYCEKNGITKFEIFKDTKSGSTSWRSREVNKIISNCEKGDRLIISELSRIGRSTLDVLDFLQEALKVGIEVIAVKNNITFDGGIQATIFATVLGLCSEIERDFIRLRTIEGMAKAKANGSKIGRPKGIQGKKKLDEKGAEMLKLVAAGVSDTAIARLLNVSRGTVARYKKNQLSKDKSWKYIF